MARNIFRLETLEDLSVNVQRVKSEGKLSSHRYSLICVKCDKQEQEEELTFLGFPAQVKGHRCGTQVHIFTYITFLPLKCGET